MHESYFSVCFVLGQVLKGKGSKSGHMVDGCGPGVIFGILKTEISGEDSFLIAAIHDREDTGTARFAEEWKEIGGQAHAAVVLDCKGEV